MPDTASFPDERMVAEGLRFYSSDLAGERGSLFIDPEMAAMAAAHRAVLAEKQRRVDMSSDAYEALVGATHEQIVKLTGTEPKMGE